MDISKLPKQAQRYIESLRSEIAVLRDKLEILTGKESDIFIRDVIKQKNYYIPNETITFRLHKSKKYSMFEKSIDCYIKDEDLIVHSSSGIIKKKPQATNSIYLEIS